MGDNGSTETDPDFERARLRRAGRVVAIGVAVGAAAAGLAALRGGSGRTGLFLVLLLTAGGSAAGAIDAAVLMVVDQFRVRESTWRRVAVVLGLLLLAFVTLAMAGGVARDGG